MLGRLTYTALAALIVVHPQLAGAQRGSAMERVQDVTIPSKTYPPARHAWVFTPADYPKSCGGGCNFWYLRLPQGIVALAPWR